MPANPPPLPSASSQTWNTRPAEAPRDTARRAAFHEAGHAVALLWHRRVPAGLLVKIGGAPGLGAEASHFSRLDGCDAAAVCALAGMAAEWRTGNGEPWSFGTRDAARARSFFIGMLARGEAAMQEERAAVAWNRAVALMRRPSVWEAVEMVAGALQAGPVLRGPARCVLAHRAALRLHGPAMAATITDWLGAREGGFAPGWRPVMTPAADGVVLHAAAVSLAQLLVRSEVWHHRPARAVVVAVTGMFWVPILFILALATGLMR